MFSITVPTFLLDIDCRCTSHNNRAVVAQLHSASVLMQLIISGLRARVIVVVARNAR